MVMIRKMKDSGIEWIGEIPEEWSIAQLKRFVIVNNGREIENEIDRSNSAIPVYGSGGVFKYTDSFMYDGKSVLFGRKGTLGKPLYVEGRFWTVDTMYFLTFKGGLLPKYNYYQLRAFDWEPHITKTALPSVVASEIVSCSFPFPSLPEQQKIADFLDAECARIDAVIEQTRASIEEYKKLKQSVITQTVTKGIRSGRKMKDSGVEWIGEIASLFYVFRLKHLLRAPLQYGANESGILYENNLPRYIRITDISLDGKLKASGALSLTEEAAKGYILSNNDVLFARSGATVGKAFIYKTEYGRAAFAGYLIRATVNEKIEPEFLFLYTQSSIYEEWKKQIFVQATIQNIGADRYSELPVVLPPIEEQQEVIRYLNDRLREIDRLIERKEKLLTEIETYKKSLIFEYVTGKKEVFNGHGFKRKSS